MILRDTVDVLTESNEYVETIRGMVNYRNVSLDDNAGGGASMQIIRQLTALTEPYEWTYTQRVRFRGEIFRIVGILWRRRNGEDHHVTLDLERATG